MTADVQPTRPAVDFDEYFGGLDDAVEHLRQMILARQEAQRGVDGAEQAVLAIVAGAMQAGGTVEDPVMRHVVRHLHYRISFLPSAELARTLGFVSKDGRANTQHMARQIGPAAADKPCTRCGGTVFTFSADTWVYDGLCTDCRKATKEKECRQSAARWEPRNKRWEHVRAGKVTAAVAEWRVATALVLAYPPATTPRGDQEGDWTWSKYEQARSVEKRLTSSLPEDIAELGVECASQLLPSAQTAADWNPDRACSLTEHLTDLSPTAVLSRLNTATTRRRPELKAEARELYADPPQEAVSVPRQQPAPGADA